MFDKFEDLFAELNIRISSGKTFEESLQCTIYLEDLTEVEKEVVLGMMELLAETRGTSKEESVKFVHDSYLSRKKRKGRGKEA